MNANDNRTDTLDALIIGGARGIGLGFVEALVERPGEGRIHAACRNPAQAATLQRLAAADARISPLAIDLTDEASIAGAAATIARQTRRLGLLINCAGVLHDGELQPERRLADVTPSALARSFAVNATGALLLAKHFQPLLSHGGRAVLANLSARVGSVGDNRLGGWYAYRAAKAAQNQITRCLSIELGRRNRALICVALHPGTVDTDLSRPFQGNVQPQKLFDVARAVRQLLHVVDRLTPDQTGHFFAWDGSEIPW